MKNALVFVGLGALVIIIGMWAINRDPTTSTNTEGMMRTTEPMTSTLKLISGVF